MQFKIDKILLSMREIKEFYGSERFKNGDCANLVLAIGKCLSDINVPFNITIIDHFTSENEDAEESDVYKEMGIPECFSHCYVNVAEQEVDIDGFNAFENWTKWLDLPSEENKWEEYDLLSDILLDDKNSESLLNSFAIIADQSGVAVDYNFIEDLSKIIRKNMESKN